MKLKLLLSAALLTLLFASGCATRATASGGRETTILGGALTVSSNSFESSNAATALDADTSKLASKGDPSGKKTTLFWGLITLHDY